MLLNSSWASALTARRTLILVLDLITHLLFILPLLIDLALGATCNVVNEDGISGCMFGQLATRIYSDVSTYGLFIALGGFLLVFPIVALAATISGILTYKMYVNGTIPRYRLLLSAPAILIYILGAWIASDFEFLSLLLTLALIPWFIVTLVLYIRKGRVNSVNAACLAAATIFCLVFLFL